MNIQQIASTRAQMLWESWRLIPTEWDKRYQAVQESVRPEEPKIIALQTDEKDSNP